MSQLYVDLDGVLADFDTGYERAFGHRPDKEKDDVNWNLVRDNGSFYLNLPPMSDYPALWARISQRQPIVLTGVPSRVPGAAEQKKEWVGRWFGPRVMVICCRSIDKSTYCRPGDALIDDWDKHRQLWVDAGGVWIPHTSAIETAKLLTEAGW